MKDKQKKEMSIRCLHCHEEFNKAVRPLMEFLGKNCHPHMKAIVDCGSAELVEGQMSYMTDDFIQN